MTTYYAFKRFEEQAERMGLRIAPSKFSNPGEERIAVYPIAEKWPCYNPDFEMWAGTVDALIVFMSGLEKGLQYANYLGWSREKSEAKYRVAVERRKVAHEKERVVTILKDDKDLGEFKPDLIGKD